MAELEACKRPIAPEPIPKAREETDEEHRNRVSPRMFATTEPILMSRLQTIGGYRACLANPNAGEVAKQNARRMIDALTSLSGPDLRQFFDIRSAKAFTEQETADMRLNRVSVGATFDARPHKSDVEPRLDYRRPQSCHCEQRYL